MDGRTVWVQPGDVEGRIEAGNVVTASRELSNWSLRSDDGSEPVPAGTALEIVEVRPWGAAMAEELPEIHDDRTGDPDVMAEIIEAANELAGLGLYEVVS